MLQPSRMLPPAAAAALLLAFSVAPVAGRGAAAPRERAGADQDPRPACCFENPRYVGTCAVEPAREETCASILSYLNDPQSAGKSYCNNTAIRGGWKIVACGAKTKAD